MRNLRGFLILIVLFPTAWMVGCGAKDAMPTSPADPSPAGAITSPTVALTVTSTPTFSPTPNATTVPTQSWIYNPGIIVTGSSSPTGAVEGAPVSSMVASAAGGAPPYYYQLGSLANGAPPLGTVVATLFGGGSQYGTWAGTPAYGSGAVSGGEDIFNVCAVEMNGNYNCVPVTVDIGAMTITSVNQTYVRSITGCSFNVAAEEFSILINGTVSGPVSTLLGFGNLSSFGSGRSAVPAWTFDGNGGYYRAPGQPQSTAFSIQWPYLGICASSPVTLQNNLTVDGLMYDTPPTKFVINY